MHCCPLPLPDIFVDILTIASLQTKNLAELCALLVDDIYGELPSVRIQNRSRAFVHPRGALSALKPWLTLLPAHHRHSLQQGPFHDSATHPIHLP